MKPAPPETAELLHRVRQQLILAQVRIMELEDGRDELSPKLADTGKLLIAAQTLADQKIDEAAHLATTLAELQAQYDHMRHMQHITNEALNETRQQLAESDRRLSASEQRQTQLQKESLSLANQATKLSTTVSLLQQELEEAKTTAATRLARIKEFDTAIRSMKASRSWRWTRWLRSLERTLGGGNP
jgi:chromosome segregation ATPase